MATCGDPPEEVPLPFLPSIAPRVQFCHTTEECVMHSYIFYEYPPSPSFSFPGTRPLGQRPALWFLPTDKQVCEDLKLSTTAIRSLFHALTHHTTLQDINCSRLLLYRIEQCRNPAVRRDILTYFQVMNHLPF